MILESEKGKLIRQSFRKQISQEKSVQEGENTNTEFILVPYSTLEERVNVEVEYTQRMRAPQ